MNVISALSPYLAYHRWACSGAKAGNLSNTLYTNGKLWLHDLMVTRCSVEDNTVGYPRPYAPFVSIAYVVACLSGFCWQT